MMDEKEAQVRPYRKERGAVAGFADVAGESLFKNLD